MTFWESTRPACNTKLMSITQSVWYAGLTGSQMSPDYEDLGPRRITRSTFLSLFVEYLSMQCFLFFPALPGTRYVTRGAGDEINVSHTEYSKDYM